MKNRIIITLVLIFIGQIGQVFGQKEKRIDEIIFSYKNKIDTDRIYFYPNIPFKKASKGIENFARGILNEDILPNDSVLELTRLFIYDGYGKNIESYVISKSFKWLKQFDKNVKVLISYADPDVNHAGGIYQATNWIYQGCGDFQMAPTYSLRVKPDGEWIHSRTVYSLYGSADPKKLEKAIGHTFWLKKEASKHRYIYFLGNKKENKGFIGMLKHPMKKYPKENLYKTEITEHTIEKDLKYV